MYRRSKYAVISAPAAATATHGTSGTTSCRQSSRPRFHQNTSRSAAGSVAVTVFVNNARTKRTNGRVHDQNGAEYHDPKKRRRRLSRTAAFFLFVFPCSLKCPQKVYLSENTIRRSLRAERMRPKFASVCSPAALNCPPLSNVCHDTWLNRL